MYECMTDKIKEIFNLVAIISTGCKTARRLLRVNQFSTKLWILSHTVVLVNTGSRNPANVSE